MRIFALSGLLGLAAISGCGGSSGVTVKCGVGTTLETATDTCVANKTDAGVVTMDAGMTGSSCGTDTVNVNGVCTVMPEGFCAMSTQTFNTTSKKCELTASACASGTELNPTKDGCIVTTVKGDLIFAATSDRIWTNLKYDNGGTVSVLGDATSVTATSNVTDSTPIYLAGVGPTNAVFPTASAALYQFGNRPALPVFWDANPGNPSNTPFAIDHQITVGEWKKCTQTWSIYKNPPRADMKHYYRVVVDAAGCPADVTFGLWFNYSTTKLSAQRSLGTPAGGIPNIVSTQQDGTAHWVRDFDPAVWTKSGVALNGNTHGQGTGKGFVPDITANPDASFWVATFIHNDGQSNGNAGWCVSPDGTTTACGIPNTIGSFLAAPPVAAANQAGNTHRDTPDSTTPLAAPYVRPYVYMPGKVGFDSVSAFTAGSLMTSTNTIPLSMLQPY